MKLVLLFIVCLVTLCGCFEGCSRRSMPSPAVRQQITEEDVRKFVLPGTPRDTIINRFGEPISEDKNPVFEDHSTDVDTILYFDFGPPQKGKEENYAFCGFEVFLKNGKAVKWSAIHRSVSRH